MVAFFDDVRKRYLVVIIADNVIRAKMSFSSLEAAQACTKDAVQACFRDADVKGEMVNTVIFDGSEMLLTEFYGRQ